MPLIGEVTLVNSRLRSVDRQIGLCGLELRLGDKNGGAVGVQLLRADCAGGRLVDGLVSRQGRVGQLERGVVHGDLALRLIVLRFVRPGIDYKKRLVLGDLAPFLKQRLFDVTRYPRRMPTESTASVRPVKSTKSVTSRSAG